MPRSSGDTLSLYNLASATGNGLTNISLGTIKGSPVAGNNISMSAFSIDSVDSVTGYTYAVESTSETYTLGFTTGSGTLFDSKVGNRSQNVTWTVPVGSKLTVNTNNGKTATLAVGSMTNNPTQTVLQTVLTHTVRAVFNDGFNDHATGYNTNKDKTVYSVDSYDGNSAALCLTIDSPITLADGTIVEAGDLNEGDKLKGFSVLGLGLNSDGTFLDWQSESLTIEPKEVTIVNLTYSFASRYYDINDGQITGTSEHPMLVKEYTSNNYLFKELFNLRIGDKLVKSTINGIEEIEITSIDIIEKTVEIISIDVEEEDTYLVNGFITHNKGGNSHTDFSGPGAPTSVTYSSPLITWVAPAKTLTLGITAYQYEIASDIGFTTIVNTADEWSTTEVEVNTILSPGTYYFRVRAIEAGLKGTWSSTLTFTR
jgi:hypothetical protein